MPVNLTTMMTDARIYCILPLTLRWGQDVLQESSSHNAALLQFVKTKYLKMRKPSESSNNL
jgi:hypothetical protein